MKLDSHEKDLFAAAAPQVVATVTRLFAEARAEPGRAGAILARANRSLRVLNSRRRRMVVDGLYELVRREALFVHLLGSDDPEALWFGWLVREGLDPSVARERCEQDAAFERCVDWDEAVRSAVEGLEPLARVQRLGSVSEAVARSLLEALGEDEALAFLEASNERAPVALRVNPLRADREALIAALASEGVVATPGTLAPGAVLLEGRANLQALRCFREGWFEVQDEGSQLLAELVAPEGLVVDLCAGAGGKSLALAHAADRLVAADVRAEALSELEARARRAGARVEVQQLGRDGALPEALQGLQADRVLVDAPCTGLGVLRRHPEHRWQVDAARIASRVRLQLGILERAALLVAPGGRLIYGTCSVLAEENRAVVDRFLDQHPEFHLVPASEVLGDRAGEVLQTAPHSHGTDGFFGAVLRRS